MDDNDWTPCPLCGGTEIDITLLALGQSQPCPGCTPEGRALLASGALKNEEQHHG